MRKFLLGIIIFLVLVSSVSSIEIVRQKNVATYIFFPIIDADGDIVTSATGLDSETDTFADGVVPDGFADLTNEATEIGTNGWYYISLTQAEMNFDYIAIQIKTSTSGAKTQHILIRTTIGDPLNLATTDDGGTINVTSGIVEANIEQIEDDNQSSVDLKDFVDVGFDPTSNGVLLQDGTGTGQIDLDIGTVLLRSATETQIDNIETDTSAYDTDAEYAAAIWNAATASYGGGATYGQNSEDILAGTVTNAQGTDVATDVAAMIDGSNRVDIGSWLGQAVTLSTGNKPDVNIDEISDDTTAPGNLELQFDGTGLVGDPYPLRQDQGAAFVGGLAVHTTMASITVILGSEQDIANMATSDDTRWTGDDDGSGAEFIFRCTPVDTSNVPVDFHFEGYYDEPTGSTNGATLQVYNFDTTSWNTTEAFSTGSVDEIHDIALSHGHKATGSGTLETVAYTIGDVLIKFKQDTTETGNAVLLIDYMTVGFVGSLITATNIVDEWESQSQSDPTGFHVNVKEVNGTAQTANDNSSDINAILVDTAVIGALGAGLSNIPWNSSWDTEVESEVDDALVGAHLDHLFEQDYDPASPPGSATSWANEMVESDGGVTRYTTNALENAPGGSSTDRFLLIDTTIDALASQTSFTLTAGSADDNAYNNCTIVIEDVSTSAQKAVGLISGYTGSSKTITLKYDPAIFTMATTDKVYILAENALKAAVANRQIAVASGGGVDVVTIETTDATDAMNTEADNAIVTYKLDHLVYVADADDPVNDSIIAKMFASDGDWSGGSSATDALEAIADAIIAFVSGSGVNVTQVNSVSTGSWTSQMQTGQEYWFNVGVPGKTMNDVGLGGAVIYTVYNIPSVIDIAGTATVRFGMSVTDAVDDLPTTGEITPGTIKIEYKRINGTVWTTVVDDEACSEAAGLIYYDEVLNIASGYREEDALRITFKSQKVVISGNDFEITGTTGVTFHSYIRKALPDVIYRPL